MDALRWILLLIGVGIFVLIYLYSRQKSAAAGTAEEETDYPAEQPLVEDDLPSIMVEQADDHSLDSLAKQMRLSGEEEGVAQSPQAGKDQGSVEQDRLIIFYLVGKDGVMFSGETIVNALEGAGLRYGDMKIYHFHDPELVQSKRPVFSVANIVDPGYFDLVSINQISTPGVAIFMNLPGPVKGPRAFDLMLSVIEELKESLSLTVRDKAQEIVSQQSLMHIREELVEQERKSALEARTV